MLKFIIPAIIIFLIVLFWEKINEVIYKRLKIKINYVILLILLLFLGTLLEATTIILVIIPLFIPACADLGIDLIHFGVIAVINTMIGLITPPFGMLLFVINAVTKIPLREIIRETWIFMAVLISSLMVLILFPDIVLWLPEKFGYVSAYQ